MKKVLMISAVIALVLAMAVPALAADGANVVGDALQTGVTSAINDVMSAVAGLLPVALGLFAAFFCVKKGMQFTKTATGS